MPERLEGIREVVTDMTDLLTRAMGTVGMRPLSERMHDASGLQYAVRSDRPPSLGLDLCSNELSSPLDRQAHTEAMQRYRAMRQRPVEELMPGIDQVIK